MKPDLTKPHVPYARCLDKDWQPTHHSNTDVTRTWRKFGWTPINETQEQDK